MDFKRISAALVFLLVLSGCSMNPERTKAKLLRSGNSYFKNGKYREAAILYSKAIQEDRRFGEAYYRLALAELKIGRVLQSMRALRRATELEPKNKDAFSKLCELYLMALVASRGHSNNSLIERDLRDLLDQAGKERADTFEVLRTRGFLTLFDKKPATAAGFFRKALDLRPADPKLKIALVEALMRAGNDVEAEKVARESIQQDKTNGPIYDLLYRLYLKQHRAGDAEAIVKLKCKNNPGNMNYLIELAAHYHRVNKPAARDEVLQRLTSNPGKYPNAALPVGEFLVRTGDYDRAIRLFRQGAARNPAERADYQLRTVQALVAAGRMQPALRLTEKILQKNPGNNQAKVLREALRLQGGDPQAAKKAIPDFEALVAQMPENPVLRYNFGRAYLMIGDTDKALVQFQEAANRRSDYIAPRLALARIYLFRHQPAMAAKLASEVLTINPSSLQGRLVGASASIAMKEFHQARATIESLLRNNPRQPDARFLMASLNVAERKYGDAEKMLRRLYKDTPQDPRGIRGLVSVYVAQGKAQQAQQLLDGELKKNPDSRNLLLVAARVAMAARNYDRAVSEYSKVLKQDPTSAAVHLALGAAYYQARDLKKAEFHFRKARQLQPDNVTANLRLAMLLAEVGRQQESKKLLQKVLTVAPDNPVALNNMAYMLANSPANLDTALTLAQRAIGRAPDNPTIMDTLGWIYLKKNLSDNAIQIYQKLADRFPTNPTWRYHLAMGLFQKGDKPQARRELRTALANHPSPAEETKIKNLLGQLGG